MNITEMKQRIKKFNVQNEMYKIFTQDIVREWTVEKIQSQLWIGLASDGRELVTYKARRGNVLSQYSRKKYYAKFTEVQKTKFRNPPQPIDRVTLKDTGDFYKTIEMKLMKSGIDWVANWKKPGGDIRKNLNTDKVLGLLPKAKKEMVSTFVLPGLKTALKYNIKNG